MQVKSKSNNRTELEETLTGRKFLIVQLLPFFMASKLFKGFLFPFSVDASICFRECTLFLIFLS